MSNSRYDPDDSEGFAAALRGETGEAHARATPELELTHRLGELLRAQHGRALVRVNEISKQRVWQQIVGELDTQAARAPRLKREWLSAGNLTQAAACICLGIGAGWILTRPDAPDLAGGRLEFSYGDLERARGTSVRAVVRVDDPVDSIRLLTEAFIKDGIAFELYSVSGSADRRLLVTLPARIPEASASALHDLRVRVEPGQTHAMTFSTRNEPTDD